MDERIVQMRDKIKQLKNDGQYDESLKVIDELEEIIKNSMLTTNEIDYGFYFNNYMRATNYEKLKQYNTAVYFAKKSLNYARLETERVRTYWLLGFIYSFVNWKKSVPYYDKCIEFYSNNNDTLYVALSLCNKATVTEDKDEAFWLLNESIELYLSSNKAIKIKGYSEDIKMICRRFKDEVTEKRLIKKINAFNSEMN